jgi:hypothetical protein
MQFTDEHVNKIFQAYRFLCCEYNQANSSIVNNMQYNLLTIFPTMVFEFVVSNTTGNNQQEKCISLDFNFRNSSEPWNARYLEGYYFVPNLSELF